MNWKCKLRGHAWYAIAENPAKKGKQSIYSCSCWRKCGASAIMTVYGDPHPAPIEHIAFYERAKTWKPEEGKIPSWAKIIVN